MQVREHLAVDSDTGVIAVAVEVVLVEDCITLLACTYYVSALKGNGVVLVFTGFCSCTV